jgi:hypothetical protein
MPGAVLPACTSTGRNPLRPTPLQTPDREAVALFNEAIRLKELERDEDVVAAYDELVVRFGGTDQLPGTALLVVKGIQNRALALGRLGRDEERLAAYEDIVMRYGDATEPEMRERVARALHSRATAFGKLGRDEDVVASCADLIARFGGPGEPDEVSLAVASGLLTKVFALGRLGREDEELEASACLQPSSEVQRTQRYGNKSSKLCTSRRVAS